MLSNKPRIGITSSAEGGSPKRRWPTRRGFDFLKKDYSNIIIEMGGVPLPLVNTADSFELEIIKAAIKKRIPVLGICRGLQVINVALGGTLYQDLECVPHHVIRHANPKEMLRVRHKVAIEKGTILRKIIGFDRIEVNSSKGLTVSAHSPDGIIEGVENPDYRFFIAVQWHPELTPRQDHSRKLFRAFIRACG